MRNKEGFSTPPPVPGQLLFSGRRGQRFRGKDLSGGGIHPRSLERDERSRWYRESYAKHEGREAEFE